MVALIFNSNFKMTQFYLYANVKLYATLVLKRADKFCCGWLVIEIAHTLVDRHLLCCFLRKLLLVEQAYVVIFFLQACCSLITNLTFTLT